MLEVDVSCGVQMCDQPGSVSDEELRVYTTQMC